MCWDSYCNIKPGSMNLSYFFENKQNKLLIGHFPLSSKIFRKASETPWKRRPKICLKRFYAKCINQKVFAFNVYCSVLSRSSLASLIFVVSKAAPNYSMIPERKNTVIVWKCPRIPTIEVLYIGNFVLSQITRDIVFEIYFNLARGSNCRYSRPPLITNMHS